MRLSLFQVTFSIGRRHPVPAIGQASLGSSGASAGLAQRLRAAVQLASRTVLRPLHSTLQPRWAGRSPFHACDLSGAWNPPV